MEFEFFNNKEVIPFDVLKIIEEEVSKSLLPLWKEDLWTAEFNEEYELDYKKAQYLLLDWLKRGFPTDDILYAGSGGDILPKLVFGEQRVIHTSMEEYEEDKKKYFPELGDGLKIVADNVKLPFHDSSFGMVLFFGLFTKTTREQLIESMRLLRNNGLMACDNTIFDNIELSEIFIGFEMVEVPQYIQNRGVSETKFTVFKKPLIG